MVKIDNNYEFINWNGVNAVGHEQREAKNPNLIPFSFIIKLPAPRYERIIVDRDEKGRILHSMPAG